MTADTKPRMIQYASWDPMDVRRFLGRHPKSQMVKIEIADDNLDSLLKGIRKQMCGIRQLSGFILTIILRNEDSLYMSDLVNILEVIGKNSSDVECLWYASEDQNADVNFRISIYVAQ